MKSLLVFGRQPALGLAELESVLGSEHISPAGKGFALCDIPTPDIPFTRLGGSVKLCEVLEVIDHDSWPKIESGLLQLAKTFGTGLSSKITVGLSVYDVPVHAKDVFATGLRLKKALKSASGQSVRLVPLQGDSLALSSAQVLHNKLTLDNGIEFVVVKSASGTILARAVAEQDINAYGRRDQNRPKRDARVGMLPPKLAQIIINLAGKHVLPEGAKITPVSSPKNSVLLDPFCGTGVILQEAALMGYDVYGTDIEQRMIDYSAANLQWLNETHTLRLLEANLQVGDATNHEWDLPFNVIACEGYLGQPFSSFPSNEKLREVMQTCNLIAKGFLKNIANQVPSGTRICIALPAWQLKNGSFAHLKLLDQIEELGYNRVDLVHVRPEELLYYRPDQVVARELLVIVRK